MKKRQIGRLLSVALSAALAFTSVIPSYAMEGLDEAAQEASEEASLETEEPSDETPEDPPAEPAAENPEDAQEDEKGPAELEDESDGEEVIDGEDGEEEEITIEPEVEEENDLVGKPVTPTLAAGQVSPTADTDTGNGVLAAAWTAASGNEASGNMVADTNDYHIGAWYVALTDLDSANTYYLVREYLDNSGNVLAADWGSYDGVTEKFVFSSWGMNLQDTSWRQIELKDAVDGISADVAKVRFTLTISEPTGSEVLKAAQDLNWPKKINAGDDIVGKYASISNYDDLIIADQDTVTRSGSTVNYGSEAYGSITVGQVEPTSDTATGNAVIADAWKAASGNEASGNMILNNDYHIPTV